MNRSIAALAITLIVGSSVTADDKKQVPAPLSEEQFLVCLIDDLYQDTFQPSPTDRNVQTVYSGHEVKRLVAARRALVDRVRLYAKDQHLDPRLLELCNDYKGLLAEADSFGDKQLKREKEYAAKFEDLQKEFARELLKARMKAQADLLFAPYADTTELHLTANVFTSACLSVDFSMDSFGLGGVANRVDPFVMSAIRLFTGVPRPRAAELMLTVRQLEVFEAFEKRAQQVEQTYKPELLADLRENTSAFRRVMDSARASCTKNAFQLVRAIAKDLHWEAELTTFGPVAERTKVEQAANPFHPMRELLWAKPPTDDSEIDRYVGLARACLKAIERIPSPKVRTNESVALFNVPAARMAACAGLAANRAGFIEMGSAGWKSAKKVPSADPALCNDAWKAYATLDPMATLIPKSFMHYQRAIALAHTGYDRLASEEIEKAVGADVCKFNPEFCYYYARLSMLALKPSSQRSLDWLKRSGQLGYARIVDASSCSDLAAVKKRYPEELEKIAAGR